MHTCCWFNCCFLWFSRYQLYNETAEEIISINTILEKEQYTDTILMFRFNVFHHRNTPKLKLFYRLTTRPLNCHTFLSQHVYDLYVPIFFYTPAMFLLLITQMFYLFNSESLIVPVFKKLTRDVWTSVEHTTMALPTMSNYWTTRKNVYEQNIVRRRNHDTDFRDKWSDTASYFQKNDIEMTKQRAWESDESMQDR